MFNPSLSGQPSHDDPAANAGKVDLVLQGSGVKGIGLVGAVNTLREVSYPDVRRVAGTSAGAIVAALIAAGMPSERMEAVMRGLDYAQFQDGGLLPYFGVPGKGLELLLHSGIYKTDFMHGWIADQLAACDVRTWADLKYTDNGADTNLSIDRRYKLVVIVSDISRGRMLRLPWDYKILCDLDPDDLTVADAVTASASIPFFFQPQRLICGPGQENEGSPTVFVDTTGVQATDFNLDASKRDRLFNNGRDAAAKFLSSWDWEQWQKDHGELV